MICLPGTDCTGQTYSSFPEADVTAEITNASGTKPGERSTDSPPCAQRNSVMSACREAAAAGREAEPCMGGEEEVEVVEELGGSEIGAVPEAWRGTSLFRAAL